MAALENTYDDLIPGAVYVFRMENDDQDFTDAGLTLTFDIQSPSGLITLQKEKSDSGVVVTTTSVEIELTALETAEFVGEPGDWRVCWRVNGEAVGSIGSVEVTPMPAGVLS